jgi:hypothetical protein
MFVWGHQLPAVDRPEPEHLRVSNRGVAPCVGPASRTLDTGVPSASTDWRGSHLFAAAVAGRIQQWSLDSVAPYQRMANLIAPA